MKLESPIRGSVRHKIMTVVMLTAGLALIVNALALFVYEIRKFREDHLAELRTQAEIVGRATAPALTFKDAKTAGQDLAMLRAREDIDAAALYGPDGARFAAYQRQGQVDAPARAGRAGHVFEGDRLALFHPIVEHNEVLGMVYLRGRSGLADRAAGYVGILAAVTAFALAVAWALSAWLQRSLTRPIDAVARAAREVIERRDLSVRARKISDDEIGVLADALNRMLSDLEHEMSERRSAESALKAADRRKDEFLATLAHELRNPLAPIRNAVYIMQAAKDNSQAMAEARAIIERQLAQMVRLIDDLLDVSRITTGKLALRKECVDVRAAARSALEAVEPMARFRAQQIGLSLPAQPVMVQADPTRLSQILLNLLSNAVKFTDSGGRIDLAVRVEGAQIVASVRDSGIGIAPEMLDEIFEMFAQADRSLERTTAGLGVGLSLARRLAEMHGGTVEARSAGLNRGAEFILRIPFAPGESPAPPAPREPVAARARPGSRRVLIADDNVDFANSLAFSLRRMGNEVRVVHDGRAALAAAAEFRPEIAFLDIGLPLVNGFDLAHALRAQPATAHSTLVAVTGWGQQTDRARAREAGFDDYIVKPADMERIQAILRSG